MVYGPGEQVAIAADDLGGSGIRDIRYSVGGGPEQNQAGNLLRLSLVHGTHTITYRANTQAGTQSAPRQVTVQVDTIAPETALTASLRPDGAIWLAWNSSSDAELFEVEVLDTATTTWSKHRQTNARTLAFFGQAGHTYRFRIRGSDGLNWEAAPKEAPGAPLTVPRTFQFRQLYLPIIGR
jgi:hypothetical protein